MKDLQNNIENWLNADVTLFEKRINNCINILKEENINTYQLVDKLKRKVFQKKNSIFLLKNFFSFSPTKLNHSFSLISFLEYTLREFFQRNKFLEISTSEIEDLYRHFDLLDIGEDHPSRSLSDTFYYQKNEVFRTQTTVMDTYLFSEKNCSAYFSIGRVYRKDDDARHLPTFKQLEILTLNEMGLNNYFSFLSDMLSFCWKYFQIFLHHSLSFPELRIRPHSFPYTDISFEIDLACVCQGLKDCSLCSEGWIEILGGGIIKNKVLELNNSFSRIWLASGMGIERTASVFFNLLNQEKKISNIYGIFDIL